MSSQHPMISPPSIPAASGPAALLPLAEKPKRFFGGRFGGLFAAGVIVLLVAAIALASLGPLLVDHTPASVPAGWATVFDGVPNDAAQWTPSSGGSCTAGSNGLTISSENGNKGCDLTPTTQSDVLSGGFLLEMTLAPDASAQNYQSPLVGFGDYVFVNFDQNGQYVVCTDICGAFSAVNVSGLTSSWHTDGFTPNSFAVRYLPADTTHGDQLTLYADGQQVHVVNLHIPTNSSVTLGAGDDPSGGAGEAIYTHVTLYAANGAVQ
ncbi:MAG: hypothetical protein ACHQ4H_04650 [Ktedonobacterales bacterium]